jgi:predicted peptidase
MRRFLGILVLMLLTISACEKEDEVNPVPPATDAPAPVTEPDASGEEPALDNSSELYQYRTLGELPYRILIPRHYAAGKRYPMHIFLHGMGERGNDNEKQLSVGSSYFQKDSVREKYPAFIVFPQCPLTESWNTEWVAKAVRSLIDTLLARHAINKDKISIGGFSMGGYGVFEIVSQNPSLFEAAVAISGDGDDRKAPSMTKTKWKIFAGKRDEIVPSSKTENMAVALQKAGASVSLVLYPEAGHDVIWIKAFSEPDFFSWLFSSHPPELQQMSPE